MLVLLFFMLRFYGYGATVWDLMNTPKEYQQLKTYKIKFDR